jgi:hypothetical protein
MSELKQILDRIEHSGGLRNYKQSKSGTYAWNIAFTLYNQRTNSKLSAGCISCAKKVYRWLKNQI